MAPSPYSVLGVSHDANAADIRAAYHRMALKCHPDKIQDPTKQAAGAETFKDVQAAYEVLKDSTMRSAFDREYASKHQPRQSQPFKTNKKRSDSYKAYGDNPIMYATYQSTAMSALRTADALVAASLLSYALAKMAFERALAVVPIHSGRPSDYRHLFDQMPVKDFHEATRTTASAWIRAIGSGRVAVEKAVLTSRQQKQAVMALELALKSFRWCAEHSQGLEQTEMIAKKLSCTAKIEEMRASARQSKNQRKAWEESVRGWEAVRNEWLCERAKFTPLRPL